MKYVIALTVLVISGVANAGSPPSKLDVATNQKTAAGHRAITPSSGSPPISRVPPDVEAVTVTGSRPRSFGSTPESVFRSSAPRTLSDPVAFDLVTEPVLVTVATGNTEALRRNQIKFPFESVQDATVRNSDVLKIRLARFKAN